MNSSRRLMAVALTALFSLTTLQAAKIAWQGNVNNDWFEAGNWNPAQVPDNGDQVVIDGATATRDQVVISDVTANLASLVITQATLVFTNWDTVLQADQVLVADGGKLTLPDAFDDEMMSNRIAIVCSDFTLATNGIIDVAGLGYTNDCGPGIGAVSSGNRAGGAGHAGQGELGGAWGAYGGQAYGDIREPIAPGSGGRSATVNNGIGGNGGGAVRIDATGQVTIHGVISADGGDSPKYGSGGSGGSIYITCHTLSGNGRLSANGGIREHLNGNGSAGRIALHYAELQGEPRLFFSTTAYPQSLNDPETAWFKTASPGTVFLSDLTLLGNDLSDGRFQGVRLFTDAQPSWAVDNLVVNNTSLHLADPGFQMTVHGRLLITDDSFLGVGAEDGDTVAELMCGGDLVLTRPLFKRLPLKVE